MLKYYINCFFLSWRFYYLTYLQYNNLEIKFLVFIKSSNLTFMFFVNNNKKSIHCFYLFVTNLNQVNLLIMIMYYNIMIKVYLQNIRTFSLVEFYTYFVYRDQLIVFGVFLIDRLYGFQNTR